MTDDSQQNGAPTVSWSGKIRPADKDRLKALTDDGLEAQEIISRMLDSYEAAKRKADDDPILREMADVDFHIQKTRNLISAIIMQKHSESERIQLEKNELDQTASRARAEAHQANETANKVTNELSAALEKYRQEIEKSHNEVEVAKKEAKEMRELAAFTKETAENSAERIAQLDNEISNLRQQEALARKLEGELASLKAEKDSFVKEITLLTNEKNTADRIIAQRDSQILELQAQNDILNKSNIDIEKKCQQISQKIAMNDAENEKKLWEQRSIDLEEVNKLREDIMQLKLENIKIKEKVPQS